MSFTKVFSVADGKTTQHFRDDRPTGRFRFDPSFTLGSIASTLITIISIALAYAKLDARTGITEEKNAELKRSVEYLTETLVHTNLDIRQLQTEMREQNRRVNEREK